MTQLLSCKFYTIFQFSFLIKHIWKQLGGRNNSAVFFKKLLWRKLQHLQKKTKYVFFFRKSARLPTKGATVRIFKVFQRSYSVEHAYYNQWQKLRDTHPLPPHSKLAASLLAHSLQSLPGILFQALYNIEPGEGDFWVSFSMSNIFIGLFHENIVSSWRKECLILSHSIMNHLIFSSSPFIYFDEFWYSTFELENLDNS